MRPALSGLESPYAIVISNADPHLNGLETSDHTPKFVRFFSGPFIHLQFRPAFPQVSRFRRSQDEAYCLGSVSSPAPSGQIEVAAGFINIKIISPSGPESHATPQVAWTYSGPQSSYIATVLFCLHQVLKFRLYGSKSINCFTDSVNACQTRMIL